MFILLMFLGGAVITILGIVLVSIGVIWETNGKVVIKYLVNGLWIFMLGIVMLILAANQLEADEIMTEQKQAICESLEGKWGSGACYRDGKEIDIYE